MHTRNETCTTNGLKKASTNRNLHEGWKQKITHFQRNWNCFFHIFSMKKYSILYPRNAKTACYFYASPKIPLGYIYAEYFFYEIYTIWRGILMVMVILAKNSLSECVSCSVGVVNVNVDGNSIRIHQWHETPLAYLFGWKHRAVIIANFDVSARSDPEYFSYTIFPRNVL